MYIQDGPKWAWSGWHDQICNFIPPYFFLQPLTIDHPNFTQRLGRRSTTKFIHWMALSGCGQVMWHNFVILHTLITSAARNDTAFKFYTAFCTEEYNKIYTQDGPYFSYLVGRHWRDFAFVRTLSCYYYRAMHIVLARYCYRKLSVCLSVCLSVTLRYAEHIGWTSSKLITRIISLGSSLLGATTSAV